jgi:hypothetical protein
MAMKNTIVFISSIVVLILMAWYLFTNVFISDEDRIYRVILKGKNCIESGSILSLPDVFAPGYSDSSGADKAMVFRVLYSLIDDTDNRSIQINGYDVEVKNESATVNLNCRFDFDTKSQGLYDAYFKQNRIRIELSKFNGRWKIQYTEIHG